MRNRVRATWAEYAGLERRIWIMAGVRAVNTMGLSLAMAFLAVYVVDDRGFSGRLYGLIMLAANLCQALAQGWAGELSDAFGRIRMMVRALASRVLIMAMLGALVLADAPLWALVPVMVLNGLLRGFFEPVAYALVADVAPADRRVTAYGLQRMGVNLGWAIGPATGGLLAEVVPYGVVFFVAGAVLVWAVFATARVRDPGHRPAPGEVSVSLRQAL
ncbi:MAG TPA: MFS transporter, partial [Kofleriaceae bacterium]|nr:MFS transporter [Kofleriaceae bacterium]